MSGTSLRGNTTATDIDVVNTQQSEPVQLMEQKADETTQQYKLYKPQPTNLVCPAPLDDDLLSKRDEKSGSNFNPLLHQPRRDMYGGDPKKGIPRGFQHILYDTSNAVIKSSNYDEPNPETRKVFSTTKDIYNFLAEYLEAKLVQRSIITGEKLAYDPKDDDIIAKDCQASASVYMRTLDSSGL